MGASDSEGSPLHPPADRPVAVVVVAAAVGFASSTQRSASRTASEQVATAQDLLTAMLDQETGVRGLAITRDESFLDPYRRGRVEYEAALARAAGRCAGEPAARRRAPRADARPGPGGRMAAGEEIRLLRAGDRSRALAAGPMQRRKATDGPLPRRSTRATPSDQAREGERLETRAAVISVLLVVGLGAVFATAGLPGSRAIRASGDRPARGGGRLRCPPARPGVGLQVTESEEEAHGFLQRHLERSHPGLRGRRPHAQQQREPPAGRHAGPRRTRSSPTPRRRRAALLPRGAARPGRTQPAPTGRTPCCTCGICSRLGDGDRPARRCSSAAR